MTRPDNLAPGQFWQPIDYTNQIQGLQAQLAALGPQGGWTPLDPQNIAAIRNGYGGNGPGQPGYVNPNPALADQMELENKQQYDKYFRAQELMNSIQNLRASQPTPFQLPGGQPTDRFPGTQAFQDVVDRVPSLSQPLGGPGAALAALNFDPLAAQAPTTRKRSPLAAVA